MDDTRRDDDPGPGGDAWWRDIRIAALVLTRVRPQPSGESDPRLIGPDAVGRARRAFPVVGLGIGLIGALAYAFGMWIGLLPLASAVLAVAAMLLLTGARAEVDLAAFAEGIGRGGDTAARGAIMEDALPGYYGVITLGIAIALKVALIAAAPPSVAAANIIAAAIAGRTALALAGNLGRGADADEMGGLASDAGRDTLWLAALAAAVLIVILRPSWAGVVAVPLAAVVIVAAVGFCTSRLGGLTFPAFGFIEQTVELAVLAILTAMI